MNVIAAKATGSFLVWKALHGRVYKSTQEHLTRLGYFAAVLDACIAKNAAAGNFWMKPGPYADLNVTELLAAANGFRPSNSSQPVTPVNVSAPPATVDWNAAGFVTPIKNQGQCGACWAFTTAATVETINAIRSNSPQNTGAPNDLSAQQLVDCSSKQGNEGCSGGSLVGAYSYVRSNGGLTNATNWPYVGTETACSASKASAVDLGITTWLNTAPSNQTELQGAVSLWGAGIAIAGGSISFSSYAGGVYDDFVGCGYSVDHAVMVVGYDTTANPPYWIVKNSWGTTWGMAGFGQLTMELPPASLGIPSTLAASGICAMLSAPSFPTLSGTLAAERTTPPAPPPTPPPPCATCWSARLGPSLVAALLLGCALTLVVMPPL